MYRIEIMDIKHYSELIMLWENTPGVGVSGKDDSKASIKKFLEKNPNTCFVATDKGKIIGTIMAGNDGRRGHIYHLMVTPEYRRNGIGEKLLKKAETGLKKEGIRKIFLTVFKTNKSGNGFWESVGYDVRKDLNYRDRIISE